MSNFLDQLREQVRLKQLGVEAQKKKPISGLTSVDDALKASQSMRQASHKPRLIDKEYK